MKILAAILAFLALVALLAISAACGAVVVMFAFALLHLAFIAVPAIGFWSSLAVSIALNLLASLVRGSRK